MGDDEDYVAALLAVLTDPTPPGFDPADPRVRGDDGIDRFDGFGRDVMVSGIEVVDGPHGDELDVSFVVALPDDEPEWAGVPPRGSTRVPFDAEWRRLSELDDPAAYAPGIASRVMSAAREHVVLNQHGGRADRARDEWRLGARARLPDREAQRSLLLETLAGEGEVRQVAPDRFELRLGDLPAGDRPGPNASAREAWMALDAWPRLVTFVLTPEEWEEVLVDHYPDDVRHYVGETLAGPDPDEVYVVYYAGSLHCSTRVELPPVRGRARERAWARLRAEHPPRPGDGWFAYDPNVPGRSDR